MYHFRLHNGGYFQTESVMPVIVRCHIYNDGSKALLYSQNNTQIAALTITNPAINEGVIDVLHVAPIEAVMETPSLPIDEDFEEDLTLNEVAVPTSVVTNIPTEGTITTGFTGGGTTTINTNSAFDSIWSTPGNTTKSRRSRPRYYDKDMREYKVNDPIRVVSEDLEGFGFIVKVLKNNKFEVYVYDSDKEKRNKGIRRVSKADISYDKEAINALCKVKIKGYLDSAKLFGFRTKKREMLERSMVGSIYKIAKYQENFKCKADDEERNCILVETEEDAIRFLETDCELVYPDYKGLECPKERIIQMESVVVCKNSKGTRMRLKEEGTVIDIKYNPINNNDGPFSINNEVSNHPLDILTVKSISTGIEHRLYRKHFKIK